MMHWTATRRLLFTAATGLGLAACGDGFFHEPASAGGSRVTVTALQVADGADQAFDKARSR